MGHGASQSRHAPEHEVAHPGIDHRRARLDLIFVVATPAPEAAPPGKRAFDDPAMRLHHKGARGLRIGALHDREAPAHLLPQFDVQRAAIGRIGPNRPQPGQARSVEPERLRHQARAIAVLHIGGGDDDFEDETLRVPQEMAFAARYLLVGIEAARPPF